VSNLAEYPPFPVMSGIEFRHIPNWSGYAAGSDGSIIGCRPRNGRGRFTSWRTKSASWSGPERCRYLCATLYAGPGRLKRMKVHRLVCMAFHGPRPVGMVATHFPDPDRRNNRADNVSWRSQSDNIRDAVRQGTHARKGGGRRGEQHNMAKLTETQVRQIRKCAKREASTTLAARYGVTPACICSILKRKTWRHLV
jgi:hypothetical protein